MTARETELENRSFNQMKQYVINMVDVSVAVMVRYQRGTKQHYLRSLAIVPMYIRNILPIFAYFLLRRKITMILEN